MQSIPPNRKLIVISLMLLMALLAMDTTIVATSIATIVKELGGFDLFPWIFSIYVLAQAVAIPISGKMADLYGRKNLILIGASVFLVGSVLSGLAWNMVSLIFFRAIQGLGAGIMHPTIVTVVGDLFTIEERAKMQGYLSSVWAVSAILGPTIGGLIVQYLSWPWIFYVNLPFGLAGMLMIRIHLRESVEPKQPKIDYLGSLLLVSGMVFMILGLLQGGVAWDWFSWTSLLILGASLALLVLFFMVESKVSEPILPPWVWQSRFIVGANLTGVMVGMMVMGLTTFLPTFAQGVLGASPIVAGFTLATMAIGWPIAAALSGKFYLRLGFRNTAFIGSSICVGACLLFLRLTPQSSPWEVALGSFVIGIGFGWSATPILIGLQSIVGWSRRGVITSTHLLMRRLGSVIGVAFYGSIINTSLIAWFKQAPEQVSSQLEPSLNAVTAILGDTSSLDVSTLTFIREGLHSGVHYIFVALICTALLALVFENVMPAKIASVKEPQNIDS